MRRTDRLFEIMQLFRGGRLLLGHDIAEKLEVSLRTIYRDIDTLVASGVPIEGERGVGYMLREPIFLPPLTLTTIELEALHLGMEIVRQKSDNDLAIAAERLLEKVDAVMPTDRKGHHYLDHVSVYSSLATPLDGLATIRQAIADKLVLEIEYLSLEDQQSRREIQPLQAEYWGHVWTCTTWCRLRRGFRVFRIDRIESYRDTGEVFVSRSGETYQDYLRQFEDEER